MKKNQVKDDMILVYVPRHAKGDQGHIDCEPGKLLRFIDEKSAFIKYFKKENGVYTNELEETAKCTMLRDLWPVGMEECPVCDGKGEAFFSCCGGDVVDGDMPICPGCHEHLGESECEECGGTGLVKIEDNVQTGPKFDWIAMAEARADAGR